MNMIELVSDAFMLFIIVNPFGNIPLFLDLTEGYSPEKRRKAITFAVLIAAALVYVVSLAGQRMLEQIFHIGMFELKIMGGVVLLVLAVKNTVFNSEKKLSKGSLESIVAVPMAFPMLVAAVSFVTGILIMQKYGFFALTAVIASVFSATWLVLVFIMPIFSRLGASNLIILSKIMYIVLASKAMNLILSSVFQAGGLK